MSANTDSTGSTKRSANAAAGRPRFARMLRAGAACVCSGLLTACIFPAMGPDYKRPAVPLPSAWRVDASEATDIVNTAWWKQFGDQDLDNLIDAALLANSDLLIATARVEEYAGKLETTNSQYFPQIGYDVGLERDQRSQEVPELLRIGQPVTFNIWKYMATISYEIDLWGRVRRSYEASRAQLLSTEDARHTVMLTVVTTVANTYIQLLEADRTLEIAQQTLDSFKKTLAVTEKKWHGGSATEIDVERARADLEDQAAVIPDLERQIAFLEDQLSTLSGANPGPVPRGRLDKLVLAQVPGGIPADVLTRRPDVLAAEHNLVAANASIGIAKTEYFPTFSLTSAYGQSSDETEWLLAETARTGILAIDFIGPIFSFGRIEGDVKKAKAMTKGDRDRYLQTIQNALREIDDALVYNQKSRVRLAALDRHVQALQRADDLSTVRFKGGSYTDLDVFEADRRVLNAQNEEIHGVLDEYLALVSVYKALGGGWMVQADKELASKRIAAAPTPTPAAPAPTAPTTATVTKDVTAP
jgi:multidrug efflux system outer membrane protein